MCWFFAVWVFENYSFIFFLINTVNGIIITILNKALYNIEISATDKLGPNTLMSPRNPRIVITPISTAIKLVIQIVFPNILKKFNAFKSCSLSISFFNGIENAQAISLNPNNVLTNRKGNIPTIIKLGILTKNIGEPPETIIVEITPAINIPNEKKYRIIKSSS
jgi:hypothetical protein